MPNALVDEQGTSPEELQEAENERQENEAIPVAAAAGHVELVRSLYWTLPADILDGWRPFQVTLRMEDLEGEAPSGRRVVSVDKVQVDSFTGPRGSGKSLSMTWALCKMMALGIPVWTNYPISFYFEWPNGVIPEGRDYIVVAPGITYHESIPLDLDKFLTFNKEIRGCTVSITELQYFVEARTSGKVKNRLLGYQLMQIRKVANSFLYDVQDPHWVDGRFGWSTDLRFECRDMSKIEPDLDLPEGQYIRWEWMDMSGFASGEMYKDSGEVNRKYFVNADRIWGVYPTHFLVDPLAAMASVKLDLQEQVISTKRDHAEDEQRVRDIVRAMAYGPEKDDDIPAEELWETLGTIPLAKNVIGAILKKCGVRTARLHDGSRHYYFDNVNLPDSPE